MALSWHAADLYSGGELTELVDLAVDSVSRTIGQYDTSSAALPVNSETRPPPQNWLRATMPYRSVLYAVDDLEQQPRWAGLIVDRDRAGDGKAVMSLATAESFLTRCFITETRQYKQVDRLQIGADLVTRYVLPTGIPMRVVVQGVGQLADGDYKDADDKTVYSALQALGMEWTVDVEYLTGPTRIRFVLILSERLGTAAPTGSQPAVTLDWPGNLTSVSVKESYADGDGANDVMATSTGQGDVRPQSNRARRVPVGMVTVQRRFSDGSNITNRAQLNYDAQVELFAIVDGTTSYGLSISQNQPVSRANPRPVAFAFALGDDVGFDISGPDYPDHPVGVRRVVSITMDTTTVTPALAGADGTAVTGG